ncbi:MAG TPA: type II toxin-antitoxin system PemK/MazF family toxin [Flavobacteriales bacterium]|nr:type II toxin-antitoxin system PemK/MazF family toxin [Flavobacteriales bacterium]
MGYSQGEIIWIDFKYTDESGEKVRPALVISNSALEIMDEVIMLKITKVKRTDGFDFPLTKEMLQGGELPYPESVVRLGSVQSTSIFIIDKRRNKVKLKREFLDAIIDKFKENIELE